MPDFNFCILTFRMKNGILIARNITVLNPQKGHCHEKIYCRSYPDSALLCRRLQQSGNYCNDCSFRKYIP